MARFPTQFGNAPPAGISPDGTKVFYGVEHPSEEETTGKDKVHEGRKLLWVENLSDRSIVQLGDPNVDNWEAVWSPDGKKLAFYTGSGSQDNVAIWDVATRTVHVLNILVDAARLPQQLQWVPDSLHIVVPQIPGNHFAAPVEKEAEPAVSPAPSITVFTSNPAKKTTLGNDVIDPLPFPSLRPIDLVLVNIQTSQSTPIAKNLTTTFYRLSPDGTKLLYTLPTGSISSDINNRVVYDVYIARVSNGSQERVAHGILTSYASRLTWSHDGTKLAFGGGNIQNDSSVPAGNYGDLFPARCYLIDLQHPGTLRALSNRTFGRSDIQWSADDSTIYATTWDRKGITAITTATRKAVPLLALRDGMIREVIRNSDGYLTIIVVANDGATRIQRVNVHSGKSTTLSNGFVSIQHVSSSQDGSGPVAYIGADVAHPSDVWTADFNFRNPQQLTHLNPQIEQRSLGAQQESVTWRTRRGAIRDGVLLLPPGFQAGKRYPTILWVYGGENQGSILRDLFGMCVDQRLGSYFNLQLLASRGYAVFVPNSELRAGHPMSDIAGEILPGVDKIVAMGITDPKRLGVYGQSYGGYSVFSLIVQTNRFKVAIATSGLSDLVSLYGALFKDGSDSTGYFENSQGRMGGTPWQYRDRYIENSPLFYLNRVQTPVLIEYGEDDEAVPPYQSREAFVGLRRLGKIATLVGYPDETHVLQTTAHQQDFWQRMLDWLNTYLPAKG